MSFIQVISSSKHDFHVLGCYIGEIRCEIVQNLITLVAVIMVISPLRFPWRVEESTKVILPVQNGKG